MLPYFHLYTNQRFVLMLKGTLITKRSNVMNKKENSSLSMLLVSCGTFFYLSLFLVFPFTPSFFFFFSN